MFLIDIILLLSGLYYIKSNTKNTRKALPLCIQYPLTIAKQVIEIILKVFGQVFFQQKGEIMLYLWLP